MHRASISMLMYIAVVSVTRLVAILKAIQARWGIETSH
jgi:hypothetical protein